MIENDRIEPDDPQDPPLEELGRSYDSILQHERQLTARDEEEKSSSGTSLVPPEQESPPPPLRILEAMLFVGGEPLSESRACEILQGLSSAQFHQFIDQLNLEYRHQDRPYSIHLQGNGYVLALRRKYRRVMEDLYGGPKEVQLSQASIDVLALIAYRQPATKQEIDSLRGMESGSLVRQLVRRGLVAVVHRGQADQHEVAYGTTPRFLELFGLKNLDDLPRTQELQQI